jgi:hypothetical protein
MAPEMTTVAATPPTFHLDLGDTFAMDNVKTVGGSRDSLPSYQYHSLNLVNHSDSISSRHSNHEQQGGWHLDDTARSCGRPNPSPARMRRRVLSHSRADASTPANRPHPPLSGDQFLSRGLLRLDVGRCAVRRVRSFCTTMNKPYIGTSGGRRILRGNPAIAGLGPGAGAIATV